MRFRKILKIVIGVAIVIGLGIYAYNQSRAFIAGPTIHIDSPKNGATLEDSFITISGTAEHISHLSLNGKQIYTNEQGVFEEKLLLLPGYNIITIASRDKFGRSTERTRELVLNQPRRRGPEIEPRGTSSLPAATTTGP